MVRIGIVSLNIRGESTRSDKTIIHQGTAQPSGIVTTNDCAVQKTRQLVVGKEGNYLSEDMSICFRSTVERKIRCWNK